MATTRQKFLSYFVSVRSTMRWSLVQNLWLLLVNLVEERTTKNLSKKSKMHAWCAKPESSSSSTKENNDENFEKGWRVTRMATSALSVDVQIGRYSKRRQKSQDRIIM